MCFNSANSGKEKLISGPQCQSESSEKQPGTVYRLINQTYQMCALTGILADTDTSIFRVTVSETFSDTGSGSGHL